MHQFYHKGHYYSVHFMHINEAVNPEFLIHAMPTVFMDAKRYGQVKEYERHTKGRTAPINMKDANDIKAFTICEIRTLKGKVLKGIGFSFCGPKDQFKKRVGRKISFKRASYNMQTKLKRRSMINIIKSWMTRKDPNVSTGGRTCAINILKETEYK